MAKQNIKKGFTLTEVMITVVILLIVLGSLLFTFVQCMFLNEQNSNLATATNDAQYVLEEMKGAFADIITYDPPDFTHLVNETVAIECDTPTLDCADLNPLADLVHVVVSVSWTERQRNRSAQLSTDIARTAISP